MSWNDRATGQPESLVALVERVASGYLATEIGLAAAVLLLALLAPRIGGRLFGRVEHIASVLDRHRTAQIWLVGLAALLCRAAILPWQGPPVPTIHDEHSLLLQAQTYLAGRLANPTHPFWEHFETFHVNQLPAYASMYFPGRGLPLAVGLLIADNAWIGVWLSVILMCMAGVWMLQAWVPAPYALLGGLYLVVRFAIFNYWVNSYWGGAFTALGAMLVIGALPRILQAPGWRMGLALGVGVAVLMTTRSYEGMLLCLPVVAMLGLRLVRPTWQGGRWVAVKVAVPATVMLAIGGSTLLAYNAATTGQPLLSPYMVNRMTYAEAPPFVISKPIRSEARGPAYFREFYTAEGQDYKQRSTSLKAFAKGAAGKLFHNWNFYIGPIFTAAFLAGLWATRRSLFLMGSIGLFFAGYVLETWNFPHYTAPLLPVLLIVLMRGFERLRTWSWRGRPSGLFLSRAMPVAALAALLLPLSQILFGVPRVQANVTSQACCAIAHQDLRSDLIAQLKARPGRDLVLIKDGPNNPLHYELAYNEPDIDASEIVFARRLDPSRDEALQSYFSDRTTWEFEWRPDLAQRATLVPVPSQPRR